MITVQLECGHSVEVSIGSYTCNKSDWYCSYCGTGPIKEKEAAPLGIDEIGDPVGGGQEGTAG